MSRPKTQTQDAQIHLACTRAQKAQIEANAKAAGAKSLHEYALTLMLNGNTQEFGFLRRKAEGALVNGELLLQLSTIATSLKGILATLKHLLTQGHCKPELLHTTLNAVAETQTVVAAVGKDVALSRLHYQAEAYLEN